MSNKWEFIEGKDQNFIVIEENEGFFQTTKMIIPVRTFLNIETGEIRFFSSKTVENEGSKSIIDFLNNSKK